MRATRLIRLAFAGQLDAGLSSIATFALQVATVRLFTPEQLGAYSLVFIAFVTVARISTEVVYKPTEVLAIEYESERRLTAARASLVRGTGVGLLTAPIILAGGIPAYGEIDNRSWWLLVSSAALVTVLSPLQDHLRRLLHIADRSWTSVQMAVVQTLGVVIGAILALRIDVVLVPFGALLLANAMSITWGVASMLRSTRGQSPIAISSIAQRDLAKWLFAGGMTTSGLSYFTSAVIGSLLGLGALGHIEAARVVARPIQVVSAGLVAVVGPRLMEAASHHARDVIASWRRRYSIMLASVAAPYLLLTATDASLNFMSGLVPNAYLVPGLVLGMVVAYWTQALNLPMESEMLGLKATRHLAWVALVAGSVEVVGSFSAELMMEFTAPVWIVVAALIRRAMYRRRLEQLLD